MSSNSLTYLGKTYNDEDILSGSYSRKQSLSMSELTVDTMESTVRQYLHLDYFTGDPLPKFTMDGLRYQVYNTNPFSRYTVPAGTTYYSDIALTTSVGTLASDAVATYKSDVYGEITVSGTARYVSFSDMVLQPIHFEQNAPITQYIDNEQIAIWYLQNIERIGSDVYKLSASSALGKLTQITHYGGIYDGSQTVSTVIASIMQSADVQYAIAAEFQNIALYGWLPIATARDNLQQVLFAINASLQTDVDGVLRITNLSNATAATISQSVIFQSGAYVKYDTPITKVVVVEHQYAVGTDTKQLFDGSTVGNQTIAFDEPMSGLTKTGSLTIVSSGANYAVVNGTGTLSGIPYIHTMREIERTVSTGTENIVRVDNATLVGITASADVADRLASYYACRNKINVSIASATVNPGTVANVFDPYDEVVRSACVESEQVTLSETAKSAISVIVGFTPWQTTNFTDVHAIVDTNSTYVFPNDVIPGTQVQCIVIGGGDGGANGLNGENGGSVYKNASSRNIANVPVYVEASAGVGGKGGAGGARGLGGNIYRFEFFANPGQSAAVNIGAGGAVGQTGGDTTVTIGTTTYSSASGNREDGGYIDVSGGVTHIYAKAGDDGIDGGDGGNGGYGSQGGNGGSAANFNGGTGAQRYYRTGKPYPQYNIGGGGGSGAVKSNVGANASDVIITETTGHATAKANGANGINASAVSAPTEYGCGGNGGNGGSGGGGCGGGTMEHPTIQSPTTPTITLTIDSKGGNGGNGSDGTAGVSGCAIFIYRKPA